MTRQQRREFRAQRAESARFHNMVAQVKALFPRGITINRSSNGGKFLALSVAGDSLQWECGGVAAEGRWSGGSARLCDAVGVLLND